MTQSIAPSFDMLPLLALGFAILVQTAVVAFFGGKLSQRMTSAEKRLAEQDIKIENKITDQNALALALGEMRVEQAHTTKTLDKVCQELTGVHRQLGNIAMGRVGVGGEMS